MCPSAGRRPAEVSLSEALKPHQVREEGEEEERGGATNSDLPPKSQRVNEENVPVEFGFIIGDEWADRSV